MNKKLSRVLLGLLFAVGTPSLLFSYNTNSKNSQNVYSKIILLKVPVLNGDKLVLANMKFKALYTSRSELNSKIKKVNLLIKNTYNELIKYEINTQNIGKVKHKIHQLVVNIKKILETVNTNSNMGMENPNDNYQMNYSGTSNIDAMNGDMETGMNENEVNNGGVGGVHPETIDRNNLKNGIDKNKHKKDLNEHNSNMNITNGENMEVKQVNNYSTNANIPVGYNSNYNSDYNYNSNYHPGMGITTNHNYNSNTNTQNNNNSNDSGSNEQTNSNSPNTNYQVNYNSSYNPNTYNQTGYNSSYNPNTYNQTGYNSSYNPNTYNQENSNYEDYGTGETYQPESGNIGTGSYTNGNSYYQINDGTNYDGMSVGTGSNTAGYDYNNYDYNYNNNVNNNNINNIDNIDENELENRRNENIDDDNNLLGNLNSIEEEDSNKKLNQVLNELENASEDTNSTEENAANVIVGDVDEMDVDDEEQVDPSLNVNVANFGFTSETEETKEKREAFNEALEEEKEQLIQQDKERLEIAKENIKTNTQKMANEEKAKLEKLKEGIAEWKRKLLSAVEKGSNGPTKGQNTNDNVNLNYNN